MGKNILAVCAAVLFALQGCATDHIVLDAEENLTIPDDAAENTVTEAHEESPISPDTVRDRHLRKLEALGFGLFNYTDLTLKNCNFHYEEFREKIIELHEDIGRAERNVKEEESDIEVLASQLPGVEQSGNQKALERLRERIEEEEDELREAEKKLEHAEDDLEKHLVIKNKINDYCRELRAMSKA